MTPPRMAPALRLLLPLVPTHLTRPARLTRKERARIDAARGLARWGALADAYARRLFTLGLIGPGEFGIQIAKAQEVAYTDHNRNIVVISPDFQRYPAVLLHEMLHLSGRPGGPASLAYLAECTTAFLTTALMFQIHPETERTWDALLDQWLIPYKGQLALPVVHHALQRSGRERRSFAAWLCAVHLDRKEAERADISFAQTLTPEQHSALERAFTAAVRRSGPIRGPRCSGPGHLDCGHGTLDIALKALGDEYARYGCETEPSTVAIRTGLALPNGGLKQLWLDAALGLFD